MTSGIGTCTGCFVDLPLTAPALDLVTAGVTSAMSFSKNAWSGSVELPPPGFVGQKPLCPQPRQGLSRHRWKHKVCQYRGRYSPADGWGKPVVRSSGGRLFVLCKSQLVCLVDIACVQGVRSIRSIGGFLAHDVRLSDGNDGIITTKDPLLFHASLEEVGYSSPQEFP